jgi:hypothetical protein
MVLLFRKCNSLREVAGECLVYRVKKTVRINHLQKSTLSDANKCRKVEFFEEIYNNSQNIALFYRTDALERILKLLIAQR